MVLAIVVLNLVNDDTLKKFHISASDEDFAAFDDIVMKLELNAPKTKVRTRRDENTVHKKFWFKNGDFNLNKYLLNFRQIKEDADEYVLFTNRPFKCKDNF